MKKKNILVILGHPKTKSFCGAAADTYIKTAKENANIRYTKVGELKFNPILKGKNDEQNLEKDLLKAQKDIKWADHLIIIYPIWWGTMPALLKGFFDRILTPGFAYNFKSAGKWDKLLSGKSAHLIITMGAPAIIGKLFMNQGTSLVKKLILNFCGIKPVKVTRLGGLMSDNNKTAPKHLETIRKLGEKLI